MEGGENNIMINLLFILTIALTLIISNYIALIYGIRLGKALVRDIPPVPIEPAVKVAKRAYNAIRSKKHKSYYQKKPPKQDSNENPVWQ
jgi:hypothetical protein